MDKAALVSFDIDRSADLLTALDNAKVKVNVALWLYSSEHEDWRLVLSAPQFDAADPREGYRLLHEALAPAGFTPENTPPVMILPVGDPFVRNLRRLFAKTRAVEGMRLGNQMIGDRFVQDAYVHRVS